MTHSFFAPYEDFLQETMNEASARANPSSPSPSTRINLSQQQFSTKYQTLNVKRIGLGALLFIPSSTHSFSSCCIISSGIHGNETAPIEISNEIINELFLERIQLTKPALFILGNPLAMKSNTRFMDENLNRLFLGRHSFNDKVQNYETLRAAELETFVDQFVSHDAIKHASILHFDLHTAIRGSHKEKFALYPYVPNRHPQDHDLKLLSFAEVEALLLQNTPSGTFSSFTSTRYEAESYTIELGNARPFGKNDLSRYQAIKRTLISILEGQENTLASNHPIETYEVCHEIINSNPSFELLVDENVLNFTPFKKDQIIWKDDITYHRVTHNVEYLVFPNPNVPIGQRAGLMLRKLNDLPTEIQTNNSD